MFEDHTSFFSDPIWKHTHLITHVNSKTRWKQASKLLDLIKSKASFNGISISLRYTLLNARCFVIHNEIWNHFVEYNEAFCLFILHVYTILGAIFHYSECCAAKWKICATKWWIWECLSDAFSLIPHYTGRNLRNMPPYLPNLASSPDLAFTFLLCNNGDILTFMFFNNIALSY